MNLQFEWDEEKAEQNTWKHSVSFEEAATVLADPLSLTIEDPLHSTAELRWVTMGLSQRQRLLVIVHTDRANRIRVISARKAPLRDQRLYKEET